MKKFEISEKAMVNITTGTDIALNVVSVGMIVGGVVTKNSKLISSGVLGLVGSTVVNTVEDVKTLVKINSGEAVAEA